MDIRSGFPCRTQGFSETPPPSPPPLPPPPPPKTSMASGKLRTRRNCLSPVSAISTSKVAGLGRDSLIYTTEVLPHIPDWDLLHNPHIHLNTLINPYYSTYKCHKPYYIHNSGNSHYHSISTCISFSTCSCEPPRQTASSPRGAAWRHRRGGKHITRLPRQPNIRSLWPNTPMYIPATP